MTTKKYENIQVLFDDYKKHLLTSGAADTISEFESFISSVGVSVQHKDDLYNHFKNNTLPGYNSKFMQYQYEHPILRFIVKKAIPTVLAISIIGGLSFGAFASTMLPAGSVFLGQTITSNALLNFVNIFGTMGALSGLGATAIFTGHHLYRKNKYSLDKCLQQLNDGIDIKNTNLAKLIEKAEQTDRKIFELSHGNILTAPFRWIKRKFLESNNAVRDLLISNIDFDLRLKHKLKMKDNISTDLEKYNDPELKNLTELLKLYYQYDKNCDNRDIAYAYLYCDDKHKNHKHLIRKTIRSKNVIAGEIIDSEAEKSDNLQENYLIKATKRRVRLERDQISTSTLNNENNSNYNPIREYEALAPAAPTAPVVVPATITGWEKFFNGTKFELSNGKFLIVNDLDSTLIKTADYLDKEVKVTFTSTAIASVYPSGKELTKSAVDKILTKRRDLSAILSYIQNNEAKLIAEIPTTKIKLNNLCASIKSVYTSTADFKLSGASLTLYNKVLDVYNKDANHTI